MVRLLTQLFSQLNSSVFVLLIILILAFIAVFRIGKWTQTFAHHDEKIKKTEDIAIDVSKAIIEIRTKVDLIYMNTNPRKLIESKSPLTLTDLGRKVASEINAHQILEKYKRELIQEVEANQPKNAYDIQIFSLNITKEKMPQLLKEDDLVQIKDEAYKNGVLIEDIMSIFGILLRNDILHSKNIPVSDIDLYEPKEGK